MKFTRECWVCITVAAIVACRISAMTCAQASAVGGDATPVADLTAGGANPDGAASPPASGLVPPSDPIQPGKWRFLLAPYLWVAAASGTVGIGNQTAQVDVSQGDAFDSMINDFNGGLSLHFEAAYDKWSLFFDGMYFRLKSESTSPAVGDVTSNYKQGIYEIGAAYRLFDAKLDESGATSLVVEPLAGVRVYYFDSSIDVPSLGISPGGSTSWADVFGGVRGSVSLLSGAVSIFGRFDVGGGGSDLAWNAITGVDVRLAHWCSMLGGYRWLSIDRQTGSGIDRFEYDVLSQGPFIAVQFRF